MADQGKKRKSPLGKKTASKVVIPTRPDLERFKPTSGSSRVARVTPSSKEATRVIRPKPSGRKVVWDIPSTPSEHSETDEELDWTITGKSRDPESPTPSSSSSSSRKRLKTSHPSSPTPKPPNKLKTKPLPSSQDPPRRTRKLLSRTVKSRPSAKPKKTSGSKVKVSSKRPSLPKYKPNQKLETISEE
ncbi:hypothetical protein PGT21_006389 [Puccinia graminis f. sp. tritici]|uniref:Uncharacterized protein n=1 Tax=Puccinia graminis f. sp. tritici TaxID=56615 RepID=A0A5B0RDC1_PUCGR|nr:hypothetical protein PGT21_006389 [Puccinia graminis f. sp. tritici]KAA1123208.1 hypothetical protein PGTUg99_007370 [Puccinia graminis f. sp. tritici]